MVFMLSVVKQSAILLSTDMSSDESCICESVALRSVATASRPRGTGVASTPCLSPRLSLCRTRLPTACLSVFTTSPCRVLSYAIYNSDITLYNNMLMA